MARQGGGIAAHGFESWLEDRLERELGPLCRAVGPPAPAPHHPRRSRPSFRLLLAGGAAGLAIGGGSAAAAVHLSSTPSGGTTHTTKSVPAASTRASEPSSSARAVTPEAVESAAAKPAAAAAATPEAAADAGDLDQDENALPNGGGPAELCPMGRPQPACAIPGPNQDEAHGGRPGGPGGETGAGSSGGGHGGDSGESGSAIDPGH